MSLIRSIRSIRWSSVALALTVVSAPAAWAQEAVIRKAIAERMPNFPKIDEVTKTPMGLYELRVKNDIYYADERGDYLIEGQIVETKTRNNLTQERIDKLTAIDFSSLPLADAVVWKSGAGTRKLAVFSDPNCSYCRRFERDVQKVKDVTVYTFLYPILGPDSQEKSRNIWCSKEQTKAWLGWMIDGIPAPRMMGACDLGALERNVAMGQKYKVNGTPTLIFEDGKRVPGFLARDELEKQLTLSSAANKK